jgi:hypothetical protein
MILSRCSKLASLRLIAVMLLILIQADFGISQDCNKAHGGGAVSSSGTRDSSDCAFNCNWYIAIKPKRVESVIVVLVRLTGTRTCTTIPASLRHMVHAA